MEMDEYQRAKLRMECLQLAHAEAMRPGNTVYSIVDEAAKYWQFTRGLLETALPAALQTVDDIPC